MSISSKTINVLLLSGVVLFFIGTFSIIFYFIMCSVIEIIISPLYPIIGWILFVIGGFIGNFFGKKRDYRLPLSLY